ncbi:MAG: hypothetical protein AAGA66_07580 [Bacteroidota bacterium]
MGKQLFVDPLRKATFSVNDLGVMDKEIRNELNQHANLIGEIRLETAELKKNLIRLSDLAESNRTIIDLMRRPLWKKVLGLD